MPAFLKDVVSPEMYEKWLGPKATAHVKRDSKRAQSGVTNSLYKEAIHAAVILSNGLDAYTGELLDWKLISTYNNEESKKGKHGYKASLAMLPTVDHVSAGATEGSFCICAWQTNDEKHDLSTERFFELCMKVLRPAGYSVEKSAGSAGASAG